jgi:hypothetical protein
MNESRPGTNGEREDAPAARFRETGCARRPLAPEQFEEGL